MMSVNRNYCNQWGSFTLPAFQPTAHSDWQVHSGARVPDVITCHLLQAQAWKGVLICVGSGPTLKDAVTICAGLSVVQGDFTINPGDACIQRVLEGQECWMCRELLHSPCRRKQAPLCLNQRRHHPKHPNRLRSLKSLPRLCLPHPWSHLHPLLHHLKRHLRHFWQRRLKVCLSHERVLWSQPMIQTNTPCEASVTPHHKSSFGIHDRLNTCRDISVESKICS